MRLLKRARTLSGSSQNCLWIWRDWLMEEEAELSLSFIFLIERERVYRCSPTVAEDGPDTYEDQQFKTPLTSSFFPSLSSPSSSHPFLVYWSILLLLFCDSIKMTLSLVGVFIMLIWNKYSISHQNGFYLLELNLLFSVRDGVKI